jgi:hypothetical protein
MQEITVEPLDDRWKVFAAEYCVDFVVSRAADRANVSATAAYMMMADQRIQALIKENKRRASERVNVSIDATLEQLRMIANGDVVTVLGALSQSAGESLQAALEQLPAETRYAIKSIKFTKNGPEIVMHDKLAAIKMIGQYYGLFSERIELSGPGGGPVELITGNMSPKEAADAYALTLEHIA